MDHESCLDMRTSSRLPAVRPDIFMLLFVNLGGLVFVLLHELLLQGQLLKALMLVLRKKPLVSKGEKMRP